jgi:hypothetical protein
MADTVNNIGDVINAETMRRKKPLTTLGVCPICQEPIKEMHYKQEAGIDLPKVGNKRVHTLCFYEPERMRKT